MLYSTYMIRVVINGYGRIGRVAHRVILEKHSSEIEVVAINAGSSTDIKGWMYLLKYDSVYGSLKNSEFRIQNSESQVGPYGLLKFESGVHRVQRIPQTESHGRIHTSTASVVVLPEITPLEVEIKDNELAWAFSHSGGPGGQNVNKVSTAVRLTHIPSGLVISVRQERTQQQNKSIALELLRSKLWEIEQEKTLKTLEQQRTTAVGRGSRAEKIRTYNFPQNRITDHRINKSWHNLDVVLEGGLEEIISEVQQLLD